MIELAKKEHLHLNTRLEYKQIEDFNLRAGNFDVILSRLVLHHLEDLEGLMKKIALSLLPNGGYFFGRIPYNCQLLR